MNKWNWDEQMNEVEVDIRLTGCIHVVRCSLHSSYNCIYFIY